jgi:hypothetical protein
MNRTLFLGREVLDGSPDELRSILRTHTESERAATELLLSLDRARRAGGVSYCFLYPHTAEDSCDGWKVRFGYE